MEVLRLVIWKQKFQVYLIIWDRSEPWKVPKNIINICTYCNKLLFVSEVLVGIMILRESVFYYKSPFQYVIKLIKRKHIKRGKYSFHMPGTGTKRPNFIIQTQNGTGMEDHIIDFSELDWKGPGYLRHNRGNIWWERMFLLRIDIRIIMLSCSYLGHCGKF